MATAIRSKSPQETKAYPLEMDALIASGAILTAVQMTASRTSPFPLQPALVVTTAVAVGAPTVTLNVNPGIGAFLIIEPATGLEEKLKVVSISGAGPYVCTVKPNAWVGHTINAQVSFEPGVNARLFVDDTPTPSGTLVTPMITKGANGQNYRISYLGDCNNGESVEDEFRLEVADKSSTVTNIKQPSEIRDMAADFTKPMEESHQTGATLSSAICYVSSSVNTATAQLTATATAGVSTISMNAHPGIGAMLILTPAGSGSNPPERVYVSNVTGAVSPFSVTISPDLEFTHNSGVDVTIYAGYSGAFLTSVNSTFQGLFAINRARGGQAGKTLKLNWVATTSQAEILQVVGLCSIEEEA